MRITARISAAILAVAVSFGVALIAPSTASTAEAAQNMSTGTQVLAAESGSAALGDAPAATGPLPKVTSTMTPAGVQPDGTTRTFTLTYKNDGSQDIKNGRFWNQYMVRAAHTTTYSVTCTSAGGATCPTLPSGEQTITAADHEYQNTFAVIADLPVKAQLVFTVVAKTTLNSDACADSDTVMTGSWARYGTEGFSMPDDIKASASSVGYTSGARVCGDGVISMTNTVSVPGPSDAPSRVLSGDPRVFTVTYENTGATTLTNVPVQYTYYVPYTGQVTKASWTCTSSGGSCPSWGSGNATVNHDNPGEDPDAVFGGTMTFAPHQKLTFSVTLMTTINTCTQDGYLRVQTYATRDKSSASETSFRQSVPSQLVEIGCSTWMTNESFAGTQPADSAWKALGEACLTRATSSPWSCDGKGTTDVPAKDFVNTDGVQQGFLKLTDNQYGKVGAALYNSPLPSKNGLVVEFSQYQYGTNHADGIGFFLADGAAQLDTTGSTGGSLGYAYQGQGTGLPHAYMGVGFDTYGSYSDTSNANGIAANCGRKSGSPWKPNAVTIRGPGNGRDGYCVVGATKELKDLEGDPKLATTITEGHLTAQDVKSAERKTRVTVYPLAEGQTNPRVTVEIDFGDGYFREVQDQVMTDPAPSLIKFGFSASTGGSKDTHLIGGLKVGTVLPMQTLDVTKVIDKDKTSEEAFNLGDKVPYKVVVTNTGDRTVYATRVTDAGVDGTLSCPANMDIPAGANNSVTCTGTHKVTQSDIENGVYTNTATAQAKTSNNSSAPYNLNSSPSSVDAIMNPIATNAKQTLLAGNAATFTIITGVGQPGALVTPNDASKLTTYLVDPQTKKPAVNSDGTPAGSLRIDGQGTWTLVSEGNTRKAVFSPESTYRGDAALDYTVSNEHGGSATGTLAIAYTAFNLQKTASDGTAIDGASFNIYPDAGGQAGSEPITSGGVSPLPETLGGFTVTGVAPGTYWLRETKSPQGHDLLAQDLKVTLGTEGSVAVDTSSTPQAVFADKAVSADKKTYTLTVTDSKTVALPLSGGQGTIWLFVTGGFVLLLALGGALWWRRRYARSAAALVVSESLKTSAGTLPLNEHE